MWPKHLILPMCLVAALAIGLVPTASVSACPGCKEAVAAQDIESDSDVYNPSQLARAYNYSIYFMLSVPALILTFFGTACYVLTRRHHGAVQIKPANGGDTISRDSPQGEL